MNRNYLTLCTLALVTTLLGSSARAALVGIEVPEPPNALTVEADPAAIWMTATGSPVGRAFALATDPMAADPMAADGALRASAAAIGSRSLPTPDTINLWTFITSVRAQQQGNRFAILETNASLLQLAETPPAPIPLPGALWLMAMGLLGFAGVRLTGRGVRVGFATGRTSASNTTLVKWPMPC